MDIPQSMGSAGCCLFIDIMPRSHTCPGTGQVCDREGYTLSSSFYFRTIVNSILKRCVALMACGSSAGMMMASPGFK